MAQGANRPKSGSRSTGRRTGSVSGSRRGKPDEYPDYEILDPEKIEGGPDVMLDVPVLKVDEIDIEVDDLRAAVSVRAELQDLVKLNVGVAAKLGKVELNIQGVEAQALLKARLDNVSQILARVLTSLDRNPKLLESVGRSIENVGEGAGKTLQGAGEAVEGIGEGGASAVQDIGRGASQGLQGAGQGGAQALQGVGQGAQQLAGGSGKEEA